MPVAKGPFTVKLNPLDSYAHSVDSKLSRMSIDKEFDGDLKASSKGDMLSAGTTTKGSAGYVAIELVSGKLHGKEGAFVLQHNATMNRGEPSLAITVVPDSGTEQLTGISGTMSIQIAGGNHSYEFNYSLPGAVK
jgi:Protein of unknown function (DUF3224)